MTVRQVFSPQYTAGRLTGMQPYVRAYRTTPSGQTQAPWISTPLPSARTLRDPGGLFSLPYTYLWQKPERRAFPPYRFGTDPTSYFSMSPIKPYGDQKRPYLKPLPQTQRTNPLKQRVLETSDELHGKSFERLIALFIVWMENNPERIVDAIELAVGTGNQALAKALVAFGETQRDPSPVEKFLGLLFRLPVHLMGTASMSPSLAYGTLINHLLQDRAWFGYGLLNQYVYPTSHSVMAKLSLLAGEHSIEEDGYHGTRTS